MKHKPIKKVLLLNGPNLNLLGTREKSIYGTLTLSQIVHQLEQSAQQAGILFSHLQSNAEHMLIEAIHQAKIDEVDFILFNPAAYTHTSIALRDALLAVEIPFIEIHLSDPAQREPFRHHSYFSDIAVEVVKGHGPKSYEIAFNLLLTSFNQS